MFHLLIRIHFYNLCSNNYLGLSEGSDTLFCSICFVLLCVLKRSVKFVNQHIPTCSKAYIHSHHERMCCWQDIFQFMFLLSCHEYMPYSEKKCSPSVEHFVGIRVIWQRPLFLPLVCLLLRLRSHLPLLLHAGFGFDQGSTVKHKMRRKKNTFGGVRLLGFLLCSSWTTTHTPSGL